MTKQLLDRVAIVTGASNGIGRGIAEALAAAGAKTALAARRTEMLVEVASGIRSAGGTALPVTTDVTREDQVAQLFSKTYETYGRVDVLVNNAGVPTHGAHRRHHAEILAGGSGREPHGGIPMQP